MPKTTVQMQIRSYGKLLGDLRAIDASTAKAIKATVKDIKARAPGWIATAVTGVYNIKKSEVTPASSSAKGPQKKAASVLVTGETIDSIAITYKGRLLTPTHFGMKPKQRPRSTKDAHGRTVKRAKPYAVTAEIFKGQRKGLGADVFLGTNKGTGEIPFQRMGAARTPIKAIKTTSVPQMLTQDQVADAIQGKLNSGLEERFNHHMSRQLGTK